MKKLFCVPVVLSLFLVSKSSEALVIPWSVDIPTSALVLVLGGICGGSTCVGRVDIVEVPHDTIALFLMGFLVFLSQHHHIDLLLFFLRHYQISLLKLTRNQTCLLIHGFIQLL